MRATYSTTYPPPHHQAGRARVVLIVTAFAILAAGAGVALYIAVSAWSAAGAISVQNRELRGQVTTLRAQERSDAASLARALAPLLPFAAATCSQDLTGPSGPAEFWFGCTSERPAG